MLSKFSCNLHPSTLLQTPVSFRVFLVCAAFSFLCVFCNTAKGNQVILAPGFCPWKPTQFTSTSCHPDTNAYKPTRRRLENTPMGEPVATLASTVHALGPCRSFMMADNRVIVPVLLRDNLIVCCVEWSAEPLTSTPMSNAADLRLLRPPSVSLAREAHASWVSMEPCCFLFSSFFFY